MTFLATYKSDGYLPDGLIAGNAQLLLSEPITLLSGQNLKRGALLGQITVGGKWVLSLAAASDGSQVPKGILVDDCDASAGDKSTLAYKRGDFIDSAVIYGAGHTVASVKAGLADQGIFLIAAQGGV